MSCFNVYEAHLPQCPVCGTSNERRRTKKEIEQVVGQLTETKADALKAAFMNKQKKRIEQGSAKTMLQLVELGKKRGYKYPEKWAENVYNSRQKKTRTNA